jgi:DNA-3-methyladenine glycosylase I
MCIPFLNWFVLTVSATAASLAAPRCQALWAHGARHWYDRAVNGVVVGEDGMARCEWAAGDPILLAYHDEEWGRPERDDQRLFELLTLEHFQSGLSWTTILRKRDGFRRAFAEFDPSRVARFGDADVERLLADESIVRHRGKIEAAIANARAVTELDRSLADLVWGFAPPSRPRPASMAELPASTPESAALAKELKARGFRFLGPTTVYAFMEAAGLVDDHVAGCVARP